jgi:hypothetical protein
VISCAEAEQKPIDTNKPITMPNNFILGSSHIG